MGTIRRAVGLFAMLSLCLIPAVQQASAASIGSYAFEKIWSRTDQPVASQAVNRTWMWGPQPFTNVMVEPYAQGNVAGQTGVRRVQYFDKSRMEITDSTADPNSEWYVTNGLLAKEMITGQMQIGNDSYVDYGPAQINVAGDENDPNGPTYASFTKLMNYKALPDGWTITQTVDRSGHVGSDPSLKSFGVTAGNYVAATKHDVASVFWDFMNSSGPTFNGYQTADAKLFSNPFFATGLPITEAYWTTVKVGGTPHNVLVQAFERRILTYTPSNPDGWKVEAGNVGRHYYQWRYGSGSASNFSTSDTSMTKDLNGNWVFLGDVTNNANVAFSGVTVTVKLLDSSGGQVASKSAYLDFSSIQPGQTLPFRVWFDTGASYDHAQTTVTGDAAPAAQPAQLTLVNSISSYLASGDYHVQVVVRNDSSQAISRPSYTVIIFRSNAQIVDYNSGYVKLGTLQPGETATIDVTFYNPPKDLGGYRVFVGE